MSEWQPIETAPKDGTIVRVRNPQMDQPLEAQFGVYTSPITNRCYHEWIVTRDPQRFAFPGSFVVPTEWNPLPEPPE